MIPARALSDWRACRLYVDNRGNYHLRREGSTSGSGPVAPYNKQLKRAVAGTEELHRLAKEPSGNMSPHNDN